MKCPRCNYLMSDLDAECPRCKALAAQGLKPPPLSEPQTMAPGPMDDFFTSSPSTSAPTPPTAPVPPIYVPPADSIQFQFPVQAIIATITLILIAAIWLPFQCSRTLPGAMGGNVITMAEYNQISNGMTYSQVSGIVGDPGTENGRTELAGFTSVGYTWQNPDGSNMICMFQNGTLVSKAQAGLH